MDNGSNHPFEVDGYKFEACIKEYKNGFGYHLLVDGVVAEEAL